MSTVQIAPDKLTKERTADLLRQEIFKGTLKPGDRVIEGKWAARFQVAQGSIREAIHILTQEGYLAKASGRSARVIHLSAQDVVQLYELRAALEGLAARLAARRGGDLSAMQASIEGMKRAIGRVDRKSLLHHDLQFHLELCNASQNAHLKEHAHRILHPFFAFMLLRVMIRSESVALWAKDLEAHQRIITSIQDGEGEVAEQYVRSAMARFASTASENWGGVE